MGRKKLIIDESVEQPQTKKRNKKQFPVVAKITADGIVGSLMNQEIKPLIAHLPIHSSEVKFYDGPPQYDPNPPSQTEPYDDILPAMDLDDMSAADQSHYSFIDLSTPPPIVLPYEERKMPQLDNTDVVEPSKQVQQQHIYTNESVVGTSALNIDKSKILMVPFMNMKETRQLPDKTDIACFWCTYEFEHTPYIIPRFEENGIWYVYGNFCCAECAMAHLLEEKEDLHTRWERIALLHRLYNVTNTRIYSAPQRAILKRFGGQLSIEEYRSVIAKKQTRIDINYPPMISLIGTIDTKPIDFYEPTNKSSNVTLNVDMISKAEEGLRLKRKKPLKERESTLDSCMNLTVRAR
jgi:hypothetical protein